MTRRHDVALGALLADVGQLAARAGFVPPAVEWSALRRELSPDGSNDPAAITAWALARHLPGRELAFAARAARPQSALDTVIAVAKRHATSPSTNLDASRLPEGELQRRRMEPVLARVRIGGAQAPRETTHLLLRPLSFRLADLDPAAGDGPTSLDLARDEYLHQAWGALDAGLARLPSGDENADAAVLAVLSLVERVGARIPAFPADGVLDQSFAEHGRLAAALAVALYVETVEGREENDRGLLSDIEDANAPRLALLTGELCGGEALFTALGAKAGPGSLTGRSTWLALLCDAVAHRLCAGLELPPSSVIYRAGTRFWLLLPQRLLPAALALAADAELALVDSTGGRVSLARGAWAASLSDLHGARLTAGLTAVGEALRVSREQPFADLLTRAHGYEALFGVVLTEGGAEATTSTVTPGTESFGEWARYEALGLAAGRARAFARVPFEAQARADRALRDAGARTAGTVGMEALGVGYVAVSELPPRPVDLGPHAALLSVAPDAASAGPRDLNATSTATATGLALGLVPPPRRGGDAPCGSLASVARGARRWGILVLDLDDRDAYLRGGFAESQRTLARSLAVARAVHSFFAGFAATLAVRDDAVHVVRTDGDLFWAVAPWDHLPGLALAVRDALHRYSGGNSAIGVCGAVALGDAGTPVGEVLAAAHEGLRRAKAVVRADGRGKDAFHLLGTTLSWGEAAIAAEVAQSLAELSAPLRQAVLARLGNVAAPTAQASSETSRTQGGALRRNRRVWREVVLLERVARGAGPARALVEKLAASLTSGLWEGRTTEHAIEAVLGVAALWCRNIIGCRNMVAPQSDNGGQP